MGDVHHVLPVGAEEVLFRQARVKVGEGFVDDQFTAVEPGNAIVSTCFEKPNITQSDKTVLITVTQKYFVMQC